MLRNYILILFLFLVSPGSQTALSQEPSDSPPATEISSELNPLKPVKLDHPRDTFRAYLDAMEDYVQGVRKSDPELKKRLNDAIRTFNLEGMSVVVKQDRGEEAAVLLKEVIDRVIVIDLNKIPNEPNVDYWRLRGTEISIVKQESGDRKGQYLFSRDTVERLPEFYEKVSELPYLKGTSQGANYREPWLEKAIPPWAKATWIVFPNWQWLGLLLALFIGFLIKAIVQQLHRLGKKVTDVTETKWLNQALLAIEKPIGLIAASLFWIFSVHALRFQGFALELFSGALQVLFSLALIWAFYRLSDTLSDYLEYLSHKTDTLYDDHIVPLVRKTLKAFVVIFGLLVVVQNLGFNVMSIFAGLGLGGLAFALAAKDTAANLFGSLMIFVDRPFKVGDWIVVDGQEGNIEEIGLRSTRIRTFYNSQISIPNSVVANTGIDNMGRREFRRVKTTLGLTYDTTAAQMEAFLEGVKKIIQANEYTRKDYFHVVFSGYGDFSLNVLLYFFLRVPDWSTELVERQNVYLEILRLADHLGIQFAFPTQSLHVESTPEHPFNPQSRTKGIGPEKLKEFAHSFGREGSEAKPGGQGVFTPPHREK